MKKGVFKILVFLCCFSFLAVSSQNDKQKKLEEKRQRLLNELNEINSLLSTNKNKEKSVINLIENVNYKINVTQNLIRVTNEQANLLTHQINTNQAEISSLRIQLQELKEDYAAMITKAYKSKSKHSKAMFLLSSNNFKQAYKRLQYLKQYSNYQKQQGEAIKSKTKTLQALNIELSEQKTEKKKLIRENKRIKQRLEIELTTRETLMASIRANMTKFASQIKSKQQEIDRIDKAINKLIKSTIATSNKKAGKGRETSKFILTPENKKLALNFEGNKGKLSWPVKRGIIKGKFGKQRSLIDASVYINSQGIKIATEKNAEVKAVFNGEVSGILIVKNGNPAIMIRHGNYLTVYMNMFKIDVKKGDVIKTGQVIGKAFTNTITNQTLIGFRVYKNDKPLNPEYWLAKQ